MILLDYLREIIEGNKWYLSNNFIFYFIMVNENKQIIIKHQLDTFDSSQIMYRLQEKGFVTTLESIKFVYSLVIHYFTFQKEK